MTTDSTHELILSHSTVPGRVLDIFVPGDPVAQGSMRSPRAGVVLHNSDRVKPWRELVGWTAKENWRGAPLLEGPLHLTAYFMFMPTKRGRRPAWGKDTAPDLDKLIRAVGDALQGVVFKNDSQISDITASKRYIGPGDVHSAGVRIRVAP